MIYHIYINKNEFNFYIYTYLLFSVAEDPTLVRKRPNIYYF